EGVARASGPSLLPVAGPAVPQRHRHACALSDPREPARAPGLRARSDEAGDPGARGQDPLGERRAARFLEVAGRPRATSDHSVSGGGRGGSRALRPARGAQSRSPERGARRGHRDGRHGEAGAPDRPPRPIAVDSVGARGARSLLRAEDRGGTTKRSGGLGSVRAGGAARGWLPRGGPLPLPGRAREKMPGEDGPVPRRPRPVLPGAPPAPCRARGWPAGGLPFLEIEAPEQLTQGDGLADAAGASTAAPMATPYHSMTGVTRRPSGCASRVTVRPRMSTVCSTLAG